MKALVVGAGGQVGRELVATAPPELTVMPLTRAELDITRAETVCERARAFRPNVVINAAAYTQVDRAESEAVSAYAVNADGAANLAAAAMEMGARLIHLSTDFVFDGNLSRPYRPDDAPAPLNAYGASKLEGEHRVMALCSDRVLVLRTAWVYSRYGQNFVKTMLHRMHEHDDIGVISDLVGSPTWARSLARAVWVAATKPSLAGIYHWTDTGAASWYDFAVAIRDEAMALGLLARTPALHPIPAVEYPQLACRPRYSVLDITKSLRDFGLAPVRWRQALHEMLTELPRA